MTTRVPPALQIQLARLFGSTSVEAGLESRTNAQWRRSLKKLLDELYAYADANVQTDEMHWFMICTAFAAGAEALKEEDFWPGFFEGMIRLNLLLLGDYPDHRKRKGGKKRNDHYKLNRFRSLHYAQDGDQQTRVLHAAPRFGFPELSISPRELLTRFRDQYGYEASNRNFMSWFKNTYPVDYAKLF
jgi:hypothetical protein